jgi:hypothetical protein
VENVISGLAWAGFSGMVGFQVMTTVGANRRTAFVGIGKFVGR